MNEIKIKISHSSLSPISDRTLRFLLKKMSQMSRDIQEAEIRSLINLADLPASEKQSLRDRVLPEVKHINGYYVDSVRIGSIVIEFSVAAVALWLLQNTVGESVKDAWRATAFHERIVDYLSTDKRRKNIIDKVDAILTEVQLERMFIERIRKVIDDNEDLSIEMDLGSTDAVLERLKDVERIGVQSAIENGRSKVASGKKK